MNSSISSQLARRQQVAGLTSACCQRWFDTEGNWIDSAPKPDARGTLWLCFGLFNGIAQDIALGNAVLNQLAFSTHVPARSEKEVGTPFDIFVTNHSMQLLVLHGAKLTGPVRTKMEAWAKAGLGDFPGNRQSDYQFHGHNDNMPAKATLGLVLGGEYFGDAAAVAHGLWNLRQLRSLLARRGLMSEYTSPTYTALTLINLTEVALRAQHQEIRWLATQCVERIWAEVLSHFHQPTGSMGGPYSRAYQFDSIGHVSNMNCLLWCAFGDGILPNPVEELGGATLRLVHHHNTHHSALGLLAWIAACDYAPPAVLVEWLAGRRYPFTVRASAERGEGGANYHAGEVATTQYQEEEFALGTAFEEGWSGGQSDTFVLQYRRKQPAVGIADVRNIYARYLINAVIPTDEEQALNSYGVGHVLADRRVALGVWRAALSNAGKDLTALRFAFIIPTHFGGLDGIEIRDGHVFIQDGPLYLALRPLNITDWGCPEPIRIEAVRHYQLVSFYNYAGPARTFSADELGRTLNGYVAVVGLATEESYAEFRNRILAAELVDYFHFDTRTVRYRLGATLLETSYAVKADRIRFATINGALMPRPIWQADALPPARLPFLGEPPVPTPLEIPYAHLRVIWAPDSPWIIAAKGREKLPHQIVQGKGWAKNS